MADDFHSYLEKEGDGKYYKMNTLAYYYEELSKKKKELDALIDQVKAGDAVIVERLEDVDDTLAQRLAEWDGKIDSFPDDVTTLLGEWAVDGTLDTVVQTGIVDEKLAPVVAQLGETLKKNDTGVLGLNVFNEDTRNVLQGQEPGTINAVLGEGNVEPFNLNAYLKETVAKLNSVAFKKDFQNPYKIQGTPALGTKLTIEFILDQDSTGAIEGSLFDIGFDYFSDSQNLTAIQLSMYQNNSVTPSDAAGGTAQSQVIDNPIILNSNKSVSVSAFPNRTSYRYKHLFVEFSMASTAVESKAFIANLTAKVAGIELPAVHVGMHRMTTASTFTQEWHELFGDLSDTPNLYDDVKILRKDVDEIQLPAISKTRFDGMKANFLGDSITDPARQYVKYYEVVQEKLGLSTVRPYGVSSSTIAKGSNTTAYLPMCERYLTMDDDADLVTVFAGTNDYGYSNAVIGEFYNQDGTINKDITTFYGGCHVLFEGLINKYTSRETTIVIMTPLPRQSITTPNATTGLYLKDYVRIIKEVAAYYSLPVLDLFEESGLQSRVPAIKTKYVPDGVHPNTLGHEVIANRLIGKLKTL